MDSIRRISCIVGGAIALACAPDPMTHTGLYCRSLPIGSQCVRFENGTVQKDLRAGALSLRTGRSEIREIPGGQFVLPDTDSADDGMCFTLTSDELRAVNCDWETGESEPEAEVIVFGPTEAIEMNR